MIQIQPKYDDRFSWEEYASQEDFVYEVIELSYLPYLNRANELDKMIDYYSKCKLVNSMHGAFIDINPVSGDSKIAEVSIARCNESCQFAKKIGAKNVVFHGSCFPFLREGYIEFWAKKSAEFFDDLSEKYDLNIFIENSMDIDTEPLERLMDEKKSDRVSVCLDVGHANYSSVPVEKWFERLMPHINYLHLSDNCGYMDEHLELGKGNIDFGEVFSFVNKLKRDIPITIEVTDINRLKSSIEYLRNNKFFNLR